MEIFYFLLSIVVLIFSAIVHEVAHGFVAEKLGDPTPRLAGRMTINPTKHLDPMMSILIPMLLIFSGSPVIFGGAKPVPVDVFNLRDGRKDLALVSLAGPLTNIILAIVAAACIHLMFLTHSQSLLSAEIFHIILTINLNLAFFNLIPIPPLDGSKVFSLLLPEKEGYQYLALGNRGMIIIFLLLAFPVGPFSLGTLLGFLTEKARFLLGV